MKPSAAPVRFLVPVGTMPDWVREKLAAAVGSPVEFETYSTTGEAKQKLDAGPGVYSAIVVTDRLLREKIHGGGLAPWKGVVGEFNPRISPQFLHHFFDRDNVYGLPIAWTVRAVAIPVGVASANSWKDIYGRADFQIVDDEPLKNALLGLPSASTPVPVRAIVVTRGKTKSSPTPSPTPSPTGVTGTPSPVPVQAPLRLEVGTLAQLLKARGQDPGWKVSVPSEGSVIVLYHVAIPVNAARPEAGAAFFRILLDPEVAAQLGAENLWNLTQPSAIKQLPPEVTGNKLLTFSVNALDRLVFVRNEGAPVPVPPSPEPTPAATSPH